MINLTIVGLGKWGLELVKSVNKNSKVVKFNSVISRNPKRIKISAFFFFSEIGLCIINTATVLVSVSRVTTHYPCVR